jgi:hypothetical protein
MPHPNFQRAPRQRERMKEQRREDYAAPQRDALTTAAGQAARDIIRAAKLPDEAKLWCALRDAYLAGAKARQS